MLKVNNKQKHSCDTTWNCTSLPIENLWDLSTWWMATCIEIFQGKLKDLSFIRSFYIQPTSRGKEHKRHFTKAPNNPYACKQTSLYIENIEAKLIIY